MKNFLLFAVALIAFGSPELRGEAKVDFVKEIAPIFEKSCIECHGAEKQKGDLRLDTKSAALKKGDEVTSIVPGDAEKSEAYRRVILPKDHDDVMPSKGDLLTKAQTDLIKAWINQGANWPDDFVVKKGGATEKVAAKPVEIKSAPAELAAVSKLENQGVSIRPIAVNTNFREATFRALGTNATDATIAPLKDVITLVQLNLAGTKVTDAGLAAVKGLTNLTHLHLEHTGISDAGLVHLKNLKNLTYLNVFNTKVSDAGLDHLSGLTNLKSLHVWQTQVTDAGISNLQKSLANTSIVKGWEIKPIAAAEPKAEPKK